MLRSFKCTSQETISKCLLLLTSSSTEPTLWHHILSLSTIIQKGKLRFNSTPQHFPMKNQHFSIFALIVFFTSTLQLFYQIQKPNCGKVSNIWRRQILYLYIKWSFFFLYTFYILFNILLHLLLSSSLYNLSRHSVKWFNDVVIVARTRLLHWRNNSRRCNNRTNAIACFTEIYLCFREIVKNSQIKIRIKNHTSVFLAVFWIRRAEKWLGSNIETTMIQSGIMLSKERLRNNLRVWQWNFSFSFANVCHKERKILVIDRQNAKNRLLRRTTPNGCSFLTRLRDRIE